MSFFNDWVRILAYTHDIEDAESSEAIKLKNSRLINGFSFNGTADISDYGICSTAANNPDKKVSIPGFTLVKGAKVTITFTNGNLAANPTLNISSSGYKPITLNGVAMSSAGLEENGTYQFEYTGSSFALISANAPLATRAIKDVDGNDIKTTYAKKSEVLGATGISIKILNEDEPLPEIGESNTMYFVPSLSDNEEDRYHEYWWINNKWEMVGSRSLEISNLIKDVSIDGLTLTFTKGDDSKIILNTQDTTYDPASDIPLPPSDVPKLGESLRYAREDHVHPIQESTPYLSTPRSINGLLFNGSDDVHDYGICYSGSDEEEKVVDISNFKLDIGAEVTVTFEENNTASNILLNVGNTGAKPISCEEITNLQESGTYKFKYDGERWILISEAPKNLSEFRVATSGTTKKRRLKNRFNDIVNVKDYGAEGDGETDDTEAFEAAAATSRTVYVPEGSYIITKNILGNFISFGEVECDFIQVSNITKYENQIIELNEKITELKTSNTSLMTRISKMETDISTLKTKVSAIERSLDRGDQSQN